MTKQKYTPRENHCRLRADTCRRCQAPIVTGDDAHTLSQLVYCHPYPVDHTGAVAALYLGHSVTEVTGTHSFGYTAGGGSYDPDRVDTLAFDRTKRARMFMVWHTCDHTPTLNYQIPPPQPAEPDPDTLDLFTYQTETPPPY